MNYGAFYLKFRNENINRGEILVLAEDKSADNT